MDELMIAELFELADRIANPETHQPSGYHGLPVEEGIKLDARLDSMTPEQQAAELIDLLQQQ